MISDIARASQGAYGAIISEIRQRSSSLNCTFIFKGIASNDDTGRLAKFFHSLDQGRHVWLVEVRDPFCFPLCG